MSWFSDETYTTSTSNNTDKRQVVDTGSVGVTADNSTINVSATSTDYGTVNSAIGLAGATQAGALDAYRMLLDTTLRLAGQHEATIQKSSDLAGQLASGAGMLANSALESFSAASDSFGAAFGSTADAANNTADAAQAAQDTQKKYFIYAGLAVFIYLAARKSKG